MGHRIVLRECGSGKSHPLGFPCLVGRGREVDLMLADPAISRRHALFLKKHDRVWIEDLGGAGGIFVNGLRVSESSVIMPGDMIRIGHTQFRVLNPEKASPEHHLVVHAIGSSSAEEVDHRKLSAIYRITAELAECRDMKVLGRKLFSHLKEIFAHDRGYIALFGPDGSLEPLLVDPEGTPLPMCGDIAQRVFQSGESLLLEDVTGDASAPDRPGPPGYMIGSALCTPLISHSQIHGLVYLDRMEPGAYTPDDLEFFKSIASIFTPLIENARLLSELRKHYDNAVETLKKTETRLIETERTAAYARLAQAMAHELRNPLMIIGGLVRRIARKLTQGEMGEPCAALVSSVERMEAILKEVDEFVSIPLPLVRLQRIDRIISEEINHNRQHWQRRSVSPLLSVCTPYVMAPVDPGLIRKAFSMVFREILLTLPQGSKLPMSIQDRNNDLEILMGEAGHRERFRDLHDTELVSGHFGSSLFLDVAHKIFTDHGGSLLLDPRSHSAFPMIIRLPRTYRPEGPLAPAGGS